MIHILETQKENLIAVKLEGKISQSDVEIIHLLIHKITEKGKKVDFYFEIYDFHGYEIEGLLADLKVDASHFSDYGNMAMVGDKKWQEWAVKAMDFFTSSEIKYFDLEDKEQALIWLNN